MTDHLSTSTTSETGANGTSENGTPENGAPENGAPAAPTFRVPDGAPQGTQARGVSPTETDDTIQSTLSDDLEGEDNYSEPWNDEQGPPDAMPEEFVDWPENAASETATETTTAKTKILTESWDENSSSNEREVNGWEPPTSYDDPVDDTPDYDQYTASSSLDESGANDAGDNQSTLAVATGGFDGGSNLPPDDDARVPSPYGESLDPNAPVNDREQDLIEHLGELRSRILYCVLAVALATVGTWTYVKPIAGWFSRPIRQALAKFTTPGVKADLITIDPTEGFMTAFQISFVAAVLITAPFLLFQIWRFVEPALTGRERRFTGTLIPFAILLFFAGSAMGYAVSPLFFQFFLQYQPEGTTPNYSYSASILILAKMLLVFGVCFQVPVIVVFLHKAGIVSRNLLIEYWRHVVVIIFTVVAILTPTWDPLTLCVCAAPPCVLYVFSLWLIKWL